MQSRPPACHLVLGVGLFVSGLAVGGAIVDWASTPSRVDIREGTTLASYLPAAVMTLSYATLGGMTTAQRSTSGTSFQILSTFADGRPVQRCSLLADLEGRFDNLTTLIARRGLTLKQSKNESPVQLGVIDVRSSVIGDPSSLVLVFTNKSKTAVAIAFDGRATEVTLQKAELEWFKTACSRLSQGP